MSSTGKSLSWTSKSMLYVRRCSPSNRVLDNSAPRNNRIVSREPVLVSSTIRSPTECLKVMKLRGRTYLFSYDGKKDWIEVSKFNKNVERETRETDCKPTETESQDELEFHPYYNLQPGTQWADVCSLSEVYQKEREQVNHAVTESTEFDLECDLRCNLPPGAKRVYVCNVELNTVEQKGENPPLLDSTDLKIESDHRFHSKTGANWVDDCAGDDYSKQINASKFHRDISELSDIGNHLSGARDSAERMHEKNAHRHSVLREVAAIASLWKTSTIAKVHVRRLKDSIAVAYPAVIDATRSTESFPVDSNAALDTTISTQGVSPESPLDLYAIRPTTGESRATRLVDISAGGDYCEQVNAAKFHKDVSVSSVNTFLGVWDSKERMQEIDAHRKSVIREVAAMASLWKTTRITTAHVRRANVHIVTTLANRSSEKIAAESPAAKIVNRSTKGIATGSLQASDNAARLTESTAADCRTTLDATKSTENIAPESPKALDATRSTEGKAEESTTVFYTTRSTEDDLEESPAILNTTRSTESIAPESPTTFDANRSTENIASESPTTFDATRSTEKIAPESPTALAATRSTEKNAPESPTTLNATKSTENIDAESPTTLDAARSTESITQESPSPLYATRSTENAEESLAALVTTRSPEKAEESPVALNPTIYTGGIYAEGCKEATRSAESITIKDPAALDTTNSTAGIHAESSPTLDATNSTAGIDAESSPTLDSTNSTAGIDAESSPTLDSTNSTAGIDAESSPTLDSTGSTEGIDAESSPTFDSTGSTEGIDAEGTKGRGANWSIEGVAAKSLTAGGIDAKNVIERPAAVGARYIEDTALKSSTAHDATTSAESNAAECPAVLDSTRSTDVIASESPAALNATRSAENNAAKSPTAFNATISTQRVAEENNAGLDAKRSTEGIDAKVTKALGSTWSTENVAAKIPTALVQPFTRCVVAENVAVHWKTISTKTVAAEPLSATRTRDGIGGHVIRTTGENVRHLETSSPLDPCHLTTGHVKDTKSSQVFTPFVERFSNELPCTVIPFVHWSDICFSTRSTRSVATVSMSDLHKTRSTGEVNADGPAGLFTTRFTRGDAPESKLALSAIRSTSGAGNRVIGYAKKKVGDIELSPPKASCHQIVSEMDTNSCEVPRPIIKRFNKLAYAVIPVVSWSDIRLHSGRELDGHSENESMCNISDDDGVVAVDDDDDDDKRHGFFFSKVPQVNPTLLSILVLLLFIILFLYKVFFSMFV